jgi:hypothetical protein
MIPRPKWRHWLVPLAVGILFFGVVYAGIIFVALALFASTGD